MTMAEGPLTKEAQRSVVVVERGLPPEQPEQSAWQWLCWQLFWHLAEVNTWLGFVVHPNLLQVLMAANKHILVMEVLQTMVEGQAMHAKEIEKGLGRIQSATSACPLAKSMLQPRWAWNGEAAQGGHQLRRGVGFLGPKVEHCHDVALTTGRPKGPGE